MDLRNLTIVVGLFFSVFVIGADSFIISPLLPAMAHDFSASISAVSLAVTLYAICYAVGSPIFGPLGDRFERRKLLLFGMSVFLIATVLCATVHSLTAFYVFRAIAGLGAAFTMPNIWALIGSHFHGRLMGTVMGVVMSALSLSIAVGVPLGTALSALSDWHMAFWGSAALGVVALALLWATAPKSQPVATADNASARTSLRSSYATSYSRVLHTKPTLLGLALTLVWMFAFYSVYTFLGTFIAQNFHFTTAQSGLVFIAYGAGNFLASFLSGFAASKLGTKHAIAINGALSGLLVLGIAGWGSSLIVLIPLLLLLALAQGFGVLPITAYIVGTAPSQRSTVTSLNNAMLYLGLSLASGVGAPIITGVSFAAVCIMAAVAFLVATVLACSLRGHKVIKQQDRRL